LVRLSFLTTPTRASSPTLTLIEVAVHRFATGSVEDRQLAMSCRSVVVFETQLPLVIPDLGAGKAAERAGDPHGALS
jgi:hypothetical protein